ncbi:hypothetical protein BBJ28_00010791 [Nothophytophthora sp. Chile5]|nr:hypothetical protein BBJ28_00010791 [Nothophytophthora sp. Chile5]
MVALSETRLMIPSVLARVQRCSDSDYAELEALLDPLWRTLTGFTATASLNTLADDTLIYLLIGLSELYAWPLPLPEELDQLYWDGVFTAAQGSMASLSQYCLLSGNLDPTKSQSDVPAACQEVAAELQADGEDLAAYASPVFLYEHDEYWNTTASIPANTSVLMFNGGLDFQTPWEFGRSQFEAMALEDEASSQKMLVEMEFGGHGTGHQEQRDCSQFACDDDAIAAGNGQDLHGSSDVILEANAPFGTRALVEQSIPPDGASVERTRVTTEDIATTDPLSDASPLLYNLIATSEQWANPSPTQAELTQFYEDGVFSARGTSLKRNCLLSGESSPRTQEEEERVSVACREVTEAMEKNGDDSIMAAFTPPNTSVLMFNGGLDFQTTQAFGRAQFEAMKLEDETSSQKLLVEMAYGGHSTGFSPTIDGDERRCGLHIATEFVLANGDALSVDAECLEALPTLVFSDESFMAFYTKSLELMG